MTKKTGGIFICLMLLWVAGVMAEDAAPSAADILSKSDEIRNPQTDYILDVKVTSQKPNRDDDVSTFQVMVSGRDKTLIETLTPAIDRGRVTLMLGKDLWVYLPNLSKPLRISLSERLIGEVSNGDIARANFTGDYNPSVLKTENIEGRNYYVLDLEANAPDVTYGKVLLWVEEETNDPYKAEFYAVSGRLLKSATYEDFGDLGGVVRPRRIVMADAVFTNQRSIVEYGNIELKSIPEKYFTKDYMKKLTD